ncbi:MAG: HAD family hydrolase, partial [Thermoproteota archaeon]
MRGIRAVLFDLGGTLNDGEPGSETFCSILHAHGITRSINEVSAALKKVGSRLDAGKMAELGAKFWVEFDLSVLGELGIWENVSSLVEAIDREWWECARISLYPEALTVLKKLREEGLKIGVVTNSLQADLEKVLSKLGLKGFFDVEVS